MLRRITKLFIVNTFHQVRLQKYLKVMEEGNKGNIIIYQSEDGQTHLEVRLDDKTVWLTQQQMADLYQTSRTNVVEHIKHIYEEGELLEESTCRKFRQVRMEGSRQVERELPFYNLDMIISLGYRIKSIIATNFRKWATERLTEYIIKGFTMDDERLKHRPMYMVDYIQHLDAILSSTGETLLTRPGSISHNQAMEKVEMEYRKFEVRTLSPVEEAYLNTIKILNNKAKRKK